MAQSTSHPAADVPRWLVVVGSIAIAFHLTAIAFGALMAEGPMSPMDGTPLPPPQFAIAVNNVTRPVLQATKFTNNYHFLTNRPDWPGVKFEVKLKDAAGKEIAALQFPDKDANAWVRHRQMLLARNLGGDYPAMPPQSEEIAAPNQAAEMVQIWDQADNRRLVIKSVARHLIPRDHPVSQPSDWSLLLARSYVRHLCRLHGAASGEITRIHQDAIPPMVLSIDSVQSGGFEEVASVFGEFKADSVVDTRRPGRRAQ